MKIIHALWAKFPVAGYGGTERVAYWLGKAQAELGHEVVFLCEAGSSLPFAKTITLPAGISDLDPYLPPGTDIVQLYGTPNFKVSAPVLINIGGNGSAGEHFHPNSVFVSADHARRHHWTEYVHNGIDLAEYPLAKKTRSTDYLAFLAKASWRVKNLRGAIAIAKKAGLPLHIAGGRAPWWFSGVKSLGMVDGATKLEHLQKAKCLLFPVIWEEPFGLAVVEALACGTPVVATPRGALPEIITKECGVLANSFAELVNAVKTIQLSPEACRARVEQCFTHLHMAEKYLAYYRRILADGRLREGFPYAAPDADPQQKTYYQDYCSAWF